MLFANKYVAISLKKRIKVDNMNKKKIYLALALVSMIVISAFAIFDRTVGSSTTASPAQLAIAMGPTSV